MRKFTIMLFIILITIFPLRIDAAKKERTDYEGTGKVFWEAETEEKIVSITFDDGPHSVFTPEILDLLDKYKAKATFFVTGEQARKYPQIIFRQHLAGHEIGNHTYNHSAFYKDGHKLKQELYQTAKVIR